MSKLIRITENDLKKIVNETINVVLNEGIDFDPITKTVSYNPSHENNVDTSIENNPTMDGDIVPNIQVWSIFKRKKGLRGDGNPLIYALKGEGGWSFKTREDKIAIERQFEAIASKFASMYPIGVTILMPSGNELNSHIAEVVMAQSKDAELIEGVICKMTTEEVDEIVLDFKSKFREYYKENFNAAYYQLGQYLDMMDEAQEKFEEQLATYQQIDALIEHDMNLISLVYGDTAYAELAGFYNQQHKNNMAQLDFQKQQVDIWAEQMSMLEEGSDA